jgi:hypothetical protein
MNYRYSVFLLLFILYLQSAKSQTKNDLDIPAERMQRLKERTVIFVLPKGEYQYIDDYKERLSKIWTITPFKVVKFKDVAPYFKTDKYAFFTISGFNDGVGNSARYIYYYLTLGLSYTEAGKNKRRYNEYCRVELYPEWAAIGTFSLPEELNADLYQTYTFRNFTLPYMMVYLKYIQQNIQNEKRPTVYHSYKDEELLKKVKNDTLYVPNKLIYSRSKFSGREKLRDATKLFAEYHGIYKVVSTDEIVNIIRTRDESIPIYLFGYVLSCTDKHVTVYDVRSGNIIYKRYTPVSYNLKSKDIKRIIDK